jgi:hypothetical protein
MAGDAFKGHSAVVWVIVKGTRTRLRLAAIRVTFEAGAVAERKAQMVGLLEVANEILDRVPSGHGFDDKLIGVGRPDVAIDAFDLPLVKMGARKCHHLRGVGHEVLEELLVQMTGDAEAIILFEVIGHFHGRHKAHEAKGQENCCPFQPTHQNPRSADTFAYRLLRVDVACWRRALAMQPDLVRPGRTESGQDMCVERFGVT